VEEDPLGGDLGVGPPVMNVPLLQLAGAGLRVDTLPDGNRILVIGPVAMAIALTPEMEEWLKAQISQGSGLVIARPDQIPKLGI
jgi:hypothetical protein